MRKKYKVIFNIEKIIECNDSASAVNIARDDVMNSDLYDYNVYALTEEDLKNPHNIEIMNK